MAAAIGRDMAAVGVHQGLSPVLDVVRDYRWGRVEETIGEDPYLVAMLGSAYVRGLQSAGVIATLKHFAGYSASRAGAQPRAGVDGPPRAARLHPADVRDRDRDGRRGLGDELLLRHRRASRPAPTRGCSPSCCATSGVSAARSSPTTGRCRSSPRCIASPPTTPTAGALALTAGIDVELPDTIGFGAGLVERVEVRARSREDLVDRAARRLLLQKVQLGLLDPDWTPEGSVRAGRRRPRLADQPRARPRAGRALDRPARRRIRACRCSATTGRHCIAVAVVGPCAGDPRTLMGCYAFPNHVLPRYPDRGARHRGDQRRSMPCATNSTASNSCTSRAARSLGEDRSGFAAAVDAARDADLCIAYVGDLSGLFGHGTSGEGCDAEDLRLPGVQAELLTAVARHRYAGRRGGRLRPAVRARRHRGSGRRSGAGVHPRAGGRRRDRRRAQRTRRAEWQAAGADPAARRWAARHVPAAGARQCGERGDQRAGRQAAVPVRLRLVVHDLRGRRPAAQRDRDRDRRTSSPRPSGSATPASGPATRSSSSTCTTWWRRSRGR